MQRSLFAACAGPCTPENAKIVKSLIDARADVAACDANGDTPVIVAVKAANSLVFRVLMFDFNRCMDSRGAQGRTALSWACQFGDLYAIQMLKHCGACTDVADDKGITPKEYARSHSRYTGEFLSFCNYVSPCILCCVITMLPMLALLCMLHMLTMIAMLTILPMLAMLPMIASVGMLPMFTMT